MKRPVLSSFMFIYDILILYWSNLLRVIKGVRVHDPTMASGLSTFVVLCVDIASCLPLGRKNGD